MRSILPFALIPVCALVACGPKLAPPASFGALDAGKYDYRAATPQGVVVAARSEKNTPHADLSFWSQAVDVRLAREGYVKAREASVETARGKKGLELSYAREDAGRTYDYVVALFVEEGRVYVVEAGGDRDDFAPARADVEQAIRSLRE